MTEEKRRSFADKSGVVALPANMSAADIEKYSALARGKVTRGPEDAGIKEAREIKEKGAAIATP